MLAMQRNDRVAGLAALLFAISAASAAAAPYTFQTLDASPPSTGTFLFGINDSGTIVGNSGGSGQIYSGGAFRSYNVPGAFSSGTNDINNLGQIVGGYSANGSMRLAYAYVLTNGTVQTISVGQVSTNGVGINDRGNVVGTYTDVIAGPNMGFVFSAGVATTIAPTGATATIPKAINNAGQIVGYFIDRNGNAEGFTETNDTITALNVPGAVDTFATGINDAGQIVGYFIGGAGERGFVFSEGAFSFFDVPNSNAIVTGGINNAGQIVGYFENGQLDFEGFLATPVTTMIPESGSLALLVSALAGFTVITNRRSFFL